MPQLNWDVFVGLPGSAEYNFEMLCRGLIRRHYGKFGSFKALSSQPGVEFHLKLTSSCALGQIGRWFGWQCRWYQLDAGRAIGVRRRGKIKQAIETTERHLPDLTDWVLWTRHPLSAGDQEWFYGLSTPMTLHLWSGVELEDLLTGDAAILRGTYFGEMVLTPDLLRDRHRAAVAPITRRWVPEVHQTVDAERELRRMLGDWDDWNVLLDQSELLQSDAKAMVSEVGLSATLEGLVAELAGACQGASESLTKLHANIGKGDLELLFQEFEEAPSTRSREFTSLPRQLRSARHGAVVPVTNGLDALRQTKRLVERLQDSLNVRLVAVLAGAGGGKTQLAAQLTADGNSRPPGVLLHGRDLHAGHGLDDLARGFIFAGQPANSMEALIAALDAASQRGMCRLPLVVDGLNEAEDPRNWKPLLASLDVTLAKYPRVLFVCTLRPEFADESLPDHIPRLEIPNLGRDVEDAIRRYFEYFKIDATDTELPIRLLRHPLTLRLFCEVTNPSRENTVGIEAMPGSLTALFDRYLEQAATRIAELSPRTHRYYEQDVRQAYNRLGTALWDGNTRSLEVKALRQLLGDTERPWNHSLVRALEQEGVLTRVRGADDATSTAPVFDPLGGHLIGDALLARHGQGAFEKWIADPEAIAALGGAIQTRHPLGSDVFRALVGLMPRRLVGRQLWELLKDPLQTSALFRSAYLEGAFLDGKTVEALEKLARTRPTGRMDLLNRLWQTRGHRAHPLNTEFLDRVLRTMEVGERDLRWSEWIRQNDEEIRTDLKALANRWRKGALRDGDDLRARWVMWTLTSTVRGLRDQATSALYWFGRQEPAQLFSLAIDAMAVNDPYVPERMVAVSYGLAMANQKHSDEFEASLSKYLRGLTGALLGPNAEHPTWHWLIRMCTRGTVELARRFCPDALPEGLAGGAKLAFKSASAIEPISPEDPRGREVDRTIHMDFSNYTLGRLIKDRSNYDMEHADHQAALAHVRGVIWALGWREKAFGEVDRTIASHRYNMRSNRPFTERYGKKYGWIGFHTHAGVLEDQGNLRDGGQRLADVDIDPSFPEPPPSDPVFNSLVYWLNRSTRSNRKWILEGEIVIPDELLRREVVADCEGPWVSARASLKVENKLLGRRVFAVFSAMVVHSSKLDLLRQYLSTEDDPGGFLFWDVPGDHYTFAGEIPWSPEFATRDADGNVESLYRETVSVEEKEVEIEVLSHQYAWESHHSELNQVDPTLVPSHPFSKTFGLRGCPQSFSQVSPNGTTASITLGRANGIDGEILYVREDLLRQYIGSRSVLWLGRGERQLSPHPGSPPRWYTNACQRRTNCWRVVRTATDLGMIQRRRKPKAKKKVKAGKTRRKRQAKKRKSN